MIKEYRDAHFAVQQSGIVKKAGIQHKYIGNTAKPDIYSFFHDNLTVSPNNF